MDLREFFSWKSPYTAQCNILLYILYSSQAAMTNSMSCKNYVQHAHKAWLNPACLSHDQPMDQY